MMPVQCSGRTSAPWDCFEYVSYENKLADGRDVRELSPRLYDVQAAIWWLAVGEEAFGSEVGGGGGHCSSCGMVVVVCFEESLWETWAL